MITSIVQLPNFFNYQLGSKTAYLNGLMSCYTGDNEVYLPNNVEISQSRNFVFDKPLYKYKVQIASSQGNFLPAYAIIISPSELSFQNGVYGTNGSNVPIYPVYVVLPSQANVVLSCNSINRLFNDTQMVSSPYGTKEVESTCQYIWTIIHAMEGRCAPTDIIPHYTYLNRTDKPIEIIGQICADGNYNQMESYYMEKYGIKKSMFPQELAWILEARESSQLQPLMNPYMMNLDDISIAIESSKPNWATMGQMLASQNKILNRSTDNMLPCEPEDESKMGTALMELYQHPCDDYWFDIITDPRNVGDRYCVKIDTLTGFQKSPEFMKRGDELNFSLTYACDLLGLFRDIDLKAHRSCTEDVTVYDKNSNQLLLYIDLVWWTLAAAPGLINSGNSAAF